MRFCIDFRYLISVSKFDSYQTPRIDELLDLWEEEISYEIREKTSVRVIGIPKLSRKLTAFHTSWGLFHFKDLWIMCVEGIVRLCHCLP